MNIEDLLGAEERAIVDEAFQATLENARYRKDGTPETRRRIEALYRQLATAVRSRDVTALNDHVRRIAHERSAAGFALSDVATAFSALEEAIWHRAVSRLPAYDLPFGHGMVATALAHGRETLSHEFDAAAPHVAAPFPDCTPFFRGTEADLAPCPDEELVFSA
jgi:RsbRD-like negative regulator of sigma factor